MALQVVRLADGKAVASAAADDVVATLSQVIAARGSATIALAGGNTPRSLYELLAAAPRRSKVDWTRIDWFWGDERSVGPDDAQSNYRMVQQELLGPLAVAAERVHRMRGEATDLDAEASRYQAELARVTAAAPQGAPPALDLVLLGLGPDGHTASLFPGTSALDELTRWVVCNPVPQHQTVRLTMTAGMLNAARRVLFVVTGADKAAAVSAVLAGPPQPKLYPAQLVQHAIEVAWYLDAEAARLLPAS